MKIKKIEANSLQEAVEEVKKIYGKDAMILSSKVVKKKLIPFLPFLRKSVLEITVGIPDEEDFAQELKKQEGIYDEINKLKETVKEVMEMVKTKETTDVSVEESEFSLRAINLINKLVNKGVEKEVARKIVESACGYDYEIGRLDLKSESEESLIEGLSNNINILSSIIGEDDNFKIIALVGPTGVGKTTTLAKIAHILRNKNKRIGVITLDSFRVGAVEQLKAFINIMELPMRVSDTPQKFREHIGELSSLDVILVDTAGRSQYDMIRLQELHAFLHKVPALDVYLTMNANMQEKAMYETIEKFSIFSLKGFIFTKLDETLYPGNIINVSFRTGLPILCLTTGQRVPEDIMMASYQNLAKLLLGENK